MKVGLGPFKKLEELAKLQEHIYEGARDYNIVVSKYPDSCDYGIVLRKHPDAKRQVKQALEALRKDFIGTVEKTDYTASWSCFVPWEKERGMYIGTEVKATYVKARNSRDDYIEITFTNKSQKKSGFRE